MEKHLQNKNILLFCPGGKNGQFGQEFEKHLNKEGAYVEIYPERPASSTFSKVTLRLFKKKFPSIFNSYIRKIIHKNKANWDYILVIRGEAFTPSTIHLLRTHYPEAKIILYLWDILETNNLSNVIPCFDKVYSFDPYDCMNNKGVVFRPLYAMDLYSNNDCQESFDYDISFIGTIHSDRARILSRIGEYCDQKKLKKYFYYYIPSRLLWIRDKILKFPYLSYRSSKFTPCSKALIKSISLSSKAILDINYTGQHSLSLRVFEAMMMKRKIITTNPEIKKYDFYSSENILVIDPDNIIIPEEFLNSPFKEINPSILQKYTTESLLLCLLGVKNHQSYYSEPYKATEPKG